MQVRAFSIALLTACLVPSAAAADWIVSPYVGARFAGSTNFFVGREGTEDNKLTFGSAVGILTDGILGVEADVAFVPGFFDGAFIVDSQVTTVMGNVIVATPIAVTQYGLRPYLTGGAGLFRARGDEAGSDNIIMADVLGMNVGGGAIGPISPRSSLRFDLRYFRNLGGDEDATTANRADLRLSFWRGTVGLTIRF